MFVDFYQLIVLYRFQPEHHLSADTISNKLISHWGDGHIYPSFIHWVDYIIKYFMLTQCEDQLKVRLGESILQYAWGHLLYKVLLRGLGEIHVCNSWDVCGLVPINHKFLLYLSVCILAYILTVMKLTLWNIWFLIIHLYEAIGGIF